MTLSRELGYSAVLVCHQKQVNATIIIMQGGELVSIPLSEVVDPDTPSESTTRLVDTQSLSYQVSQTYMIRLKRHDLHQKKLVRRYAEMAGMKVNDFIQKFSYIAL